MARCVTVPGAGSGCSEPIVVFLEGGFESLSHRLANIIREQLALLGPYERPVHGIQNPKAFDVT